MPNVQPQSERIARFRVSLEPLSRREPGGVQRLACEGQQHAEGGEQLGAAHERLGRRQGESGCLGRIVEWRRRWRALKAAHVMEKRVRCMCPPALGRCPASLIRIHHMLAILHIEHAFLGRAVGSENQVCAGG